MKILGAKKVAAVFLAVSFAFFPAVPTGVAGNPPVDQRNAMKSYTPTVKATTTNTTEHMIIPSGSLYDPGPLSLATSPKVATPSEVTVTPPTSEGVITVSGTKTANTSLWYSKDGGVNYTQLTNSGAATTWYENIKLPVGGNIVKIVARTMVQVSPGVVADLASTPVDLGMITYAPLATQAATDTALNDLTVRLGVTADTITVQGAVEDPATNIISVSLVHNNEVHRYVTFPDDHTEYYDPSQTLRDILINGHSVLRELNEEFTARYATSGFALGFTINNIVYDAPKKSYVMSLHLNDILNLWNFRPENSWIYTVSSEDGVFKGRLESFLPDRERLVSYEEHLLKDFTKDKLNGWSGFYQLIGIGNFSYYSKNGDLLLPDYSNYGGPVANEASADFDANGKNIKNETKYFNFDGTLRLDLVEDSSSFPPFNVNYNYDYDANKRVIWRGMTDSTGRDLRTTYQYDDGGNLIRTKDYIVPQGLADAQATKLEQLLDPQGGMTREQKIAAIQQITDFLNQYIDVLTSSEVGALFHRWVPDTISSDQDLLADFIRGLVTLFLEEFSSETYLPNGRAGGTGDPFYKDTPIQFAAGLAKAIGQKELFNDFVLNFPKRLIRSDFEETAEHFEQKRQMLLSLWQDYGVCVLDDENMLGYDTEHSVLQNLKELFMSYPQKYLSKLNVIELVSRSTLVGGNALPGAVLLSVHVENPVPVENLKNGSIGPLCVSYLLHEMGHVIHRSGAAANVDDVYRDLHDRSSPREIVPGARTAALYAEEFAETVRQWLRDSRGLLAHAQDFAAQGKALLLEKVVFVANLFRDEDGRLIGYLETTTDNSVRFEHFVMEITQAVQIAATTAVNDLIVRLGVTADSITVLGAIEDPITHVIRTSLFYSGNGAIYRYATFPDDHTEYYDPSQTLRDILLKGNSLQKALTGELAARGWLTGFQIDAIVYDPATQTYSFSIPMTVAGMGPNQSWTYSVFKVGDAVKGQFKLALDGKPAQIEEDQLTDNESAGILTSKRGNPWDGSFRLGRLTQYVYSALGQLMSTITSDYEYDSNGTQTRYEEKTIDEDGRIKEHLIRVGGEGSSNFTSFTYDYDDQKRIILKRAILPDGSDIRTIYRYDESSNVIETTDHALPQAAAAFATQISRLLDPASGMTRDEKMAFINMFVENLNWFTFGELTQLFGRWVPDSIAVDQDLLAGLVENLVNLLLTKYSSQGFEFSKFPPIQFAAGLAKSIDRKELFETFILNFPKRLVTSSFEETVEHFEQRKTDLLTLWRDYGVFILEDENMLGYDLNRSVVQNLTVLFSVYLNHPDYLRELNVFWLYGKPSAAGGGFGLTGGVSLNINIINPIAVENLKNGLVGPLCVSYLLHEIGHIIHKSGAVANVDDVFRDLYDRSGSGEFVSDYGATRYVEDFAETVSQWWVDSRGLLTRAKDLAAQGKTMLLEKVMFVANLFRDENGQLIGYLTDQFPANNLVSIERFVIEETPAIPPAVTQFVQQLRTQMSGWDTNATLISNSQPPQYRIIVGIPEGSQGVPLQGAFLGMSFTVSEAGRVIGFPTASYEGREGVDSELLWGVRSELFTLAYPGLGVSMPPPGSEWMVDASYVTQMKEINIAWVETTGVIHFTFKDNSYRAYRDADGNAQVRGESQVTSELLAEAQSILGNAVVKGVLITPQLGAQGAPAISEFFNAAGELVGRYVTNPSLGPGNQPWWYKGEQLIRVLNLDGSMTLYEYGADYKMTVEFDAAGVPISAVKAYLGTSLWKASEAYTQEELSLRVLGTTICTSDGACMAVPPPHIYPGEPGVPWSVYQRLATYKLRRVNPETGVITTTNYGVMGLFQKVETASAAVLTEAKVVLGDSITRGFVICPAKDAVDMTTVIEFYNGSILVGKHVGNAIADPPVDEWYKVNANGELVLV